MGAIAGIQRVGGHVVVDFVNTVGGLPGPTPDDEYLFGYDDLATWAEQGELLEPTIIAAVRAAAASNPASADAVFSRVLRLRRHLDAIMRSHINQLPVSQGDLDVLQDTYAKAVTRALLHRDGTHYSWAWKATGDERDLELLVWVLAHQAVDLLNHGPLDRLSQCRHCRWLFLDASKNRTRRWCSMNACGATMKMRRYRATRRPTRTNR
jgi:predicted RNA-binding Zn ribbon-like protein